MNIADIDGKIASIQMQFPDTIKIERVSGTLSGVAVSYRGVRLDAFDASELSSSLVRKLVNVYCMAREHGRMGVKLKGE